MTTEKMTEQLARIEKFITSQSVFQKEFLTINEAAQFLSLRVNTLYKLTSADTIPHYCPNGKRLYFKRKELVDWVFDASKGKTKKQKTSVASIGVA